MIEDIEKGTLDDYLKLIGDDAEKISPFIRYHILFYHVAEYAMGAGENCKAPKFFTFAYDFLQKNNDSLIEPAIKFYEKAQGWYGLAYILFNEVLRPLPDEEDHPARDGLKHAKESFERTVHDIEVLAKYKKIHEDKEQLISSI